MGSSMWNSFHVISSVAPSEETFTTLSSAPPTEIEELPGFGLRDRDGVTHRPIRMTAREEKDAPALAASSTFFGG